MSDKTKVEEQGWDELYAMWFECLNCGSIDLIIDKNDNYS